MKIFSMGWIFVLGLICGIIIDKTITPAGAKVAEMNYVDLKYDRDFKKAVQAIVEDCTVKGDGIGCW